jgi:hypothetical protein
MIKKLSSVFLSLLSTPLLIVLPLMLTPAIGVTFQPKGKPEQTAGGASRGICAAGNFGDKNAFAALIPATDEELIAAAYPTVLVKVPESKSVQAEFILWDENSNPIYQTTVTLNGKPGIFSFSVPSIIEPLAIGKRYQWNVAIVCDARNRQQDIVVGGWLHRGLLSQILNNQLEGADDLQKAQIYAQNGFWYDTVATLAQLKRSRPEDPKIAAEWLQLLESVGLAQFSQTPLAVLPEKSTP